MKDKAGTRSDLKAAKRSQVFFLNLEKRVQKCLVNKALIDLIDLSNQ